VCEALSLDIFLSWFFICSGIIIPADTIPSFHCLFCEGYEDRGSSSSGVLAVDFIALAPIAVHLAENAAQLSSQVTVYTNGSTELGSAVQSALTGKEDPKVFRVDTRPISRLSLVFPPGSQEHKAINVEFADGTSSTEAFLVHKPSTQIKGPFATQLGLELSPSPIPLIADIAANPPFYQTSARGVFAAGDCITPYKVIAQAISSGCNAAVGASAQLLAEKHGHHSLI
jgi:thioredoxin reductase